MLCTKFRNIDGYEIMSRKQLETILSTSYFPKPAPKPIQPTPKITIPTPKTKKTHTRVYTSSKTQEANTYNQKRLKVILIII